MPKIRNKQLEREAGLLSADATGRALIASSFFDSTTTTNDKFASGSIGLSRLEEAVIQADGGQAFTANQSMGSNKITSLADGTDPNDAVNKSQLDAVAAGISWKEAAKARTTQDLASETFGSSGVTYANGTAGVGATLTQDVASDGAFGSLDTIAIVLNDRVLVMNQASAFQNGIYELTTAGDGVSTPWVLTRVTDADVSAELDGAAIFVQQGSVHADTAWVQTSDAPTIGTTLLGFTRFTPAASSGTPRQETVTTQVITGTDTAITDTLNFSPTSSASVKLYLNGLIQTQGSGADYTVSGTTITWLASSGTAVDMDTSDILVAVYES